MLELYSSWFLSGSQTGGIQEAVNQTLGAARIVVEGVLKPTTTIKIKAPGRLILDFREASLDFSGNTQPGSVGLQFQSPVDILAWQSSISNTQASPLMFLAGSEGSTINGLEIFGGNLGNNQGHASGVFVYNVPGVIECRDCYVHHGNGNGLRGGRLKLRGCHVDTTSIITPVADANGVLQGAHSAEGITAGPWCDIEDCLIENAWTTGILIYCAENYQGIYLRNDRIRNSSQWSAIAPQIGNNPAIGLVANQYTMRDIEVSGNSGWDDQVDPKTGIAAPTTSHLMSVKASPGGMIECGRVFGNRAWGCQQATQIVYGLGTGQLVDWVAS